MATKSQGILLGCGFVILSATGALVLTALFFGFLGNPFGLTKDGVGLVEVHGPIADAQFWVEEIDAMRRDSNVRAVVIHLDTPGGAVAPSQELYEAIRRLTRRKPVVASMGAIAASGGYYAAVAADSIMANPGTLTGSIGVIFQFPVLSGLLEKIGVEHHVYKSGELKDVASYSRRPTEAEEDLFDGLVADSFGQFVDAVTEGRPLSREDVLALADGRVFTGKQALEVGLVDILGDRYDAVNLAARLGGLGAEPPIIRKRKPLSPLLQFMDFFLQESSSPQLAYRFR